MKIVIIDDDVLVTQSLKMIIEAQSEIEVAAIGNSAEEGVELYRNLRPEILLSDIRMGKATGIDAAREIFSFDPNAKILFLTTFSDDEYILDALKMGAKGYLQKQNFDAIIPALKAVHRGQSVFGTEIVEKIPPLLQQEEKNTLIAFDLTEREYEILNAVAEGLSNKEIAAELFLSEGTVRNYISTLLEKLDLRDRTQLAIFYYKNR